MSSRQLRKQARLNGAKAAGSKTPAGIRKSSANSLKHGLTGKTVVLASESQKDLDDLHLTYVQEFQPESGVEMDLVDQMVAAQWRLRRMWSYETAMIDVEMDAQAPDFEKRFEKYDEDMRGGSAFSALVDKSRGLSTALRYDIHLSRTYRRSLQELYRLRGTRLQNKPTEPPKSQLNGARMANDLSNRR
jgi:hypothetical protein